VGRRSADGDYARFVEAALDLAEVAGELPRRARFGVALAILRMCESEQLARTALFAGSARRLELATSRVRAARELLADAAVDARHLRAA
jgi:hypothetical protein